MSKDGSPVKKTAEIPTTSDTRTDPTTSESASGDSLAGIIQDSVVPQSESPTASNWDYTINFDTSPGVHVLQNPKQDCAFAVTPHQNTTTVAKLSGADGRTQTEMTQQYPSFAEGMAAAVEGIDWGSLPPNSEPSIWAYEGFNHDEHESFPAYLEGDSYDACGSHYFSNESADYGVEIASYAAPSSDRTTVGVLTITTGAERGRGAIVHREIEHSQRPIFVRFLALLEAGLSSTIYQHEGAFVDAESVQSIPALPTSEKEHITSPRVEIEQESMKPATPETPGSEPATAGAGLGGSSGQQAAASLPSRMSPDEEPDEKSLEDFLED